MKYFIVALMMTILSLYAVLDHQITTINDLKMTINTEAEQFNTLKTGINYLGNRYQSPDNPPLLWPIVPEDYDGHGRISSYYGLRDDPLRANIGGSDFKDHPAIDITGLPGARVENVGWGTVIHKYYPRGWHMINGVLKYFSGHPDFNGYVEILLDTGFITKNGHVYDITVHEGDRVAPGQEIAKINPMKDPKSTGPHLHFGLLDPEGNPVNPLRYLRRGD